MAGEAWGVKGLEYLILDDHLHIGPQSESFSDAPGTIFEFRSRTEHIDKVPSQMRLSLAQSRLKNTQTLDYPEWLEYDRNALRLA